MWEFFGWIPKLFGSAKATIATVKDGQELGRQIGQSKPWRWFIERLGFESDDTPTITQTPEILVIGPGGVGKSTFAKLICEKAVPNDRRYVESIGVETTIAASMERVIVIAPGQQHRRRIIWRELET